MFRTEINLPPSDYFINLNTPVLSIGSCFAQIIGNKLKENKFDVISNPFGVIYNPLSIFKLLEYSIFNNVPDETTYVKNHGVYYNYDFHSDLSELKKDHLKKKINNKINDIHQFLDRVEWIMLTFGTAFIYRRIDNNEIVANCHKIQAKSFNKSLLEVDDILFAFEKQYKKLTYFNENLKFIITVSPVRHLKDNLIQNTISKSILRIACEELRILYPNVGYFPSYEFMMDDLRDYRFYGPDLVHPNEMAENYIWDKFTRRYMNDDTHQFLKEWGKIKKSIAHRPYFPKSEAHQKFVRKTIENLEKFKNKIDINEEVDFLKKQLYEQ